MIQKAMKILALDTALNACSVAIVSGDTVLAHEHTERARGHAESLLPMIKSLMLEAQLTFDELDRIAVSVGPGTFTGLRIGLAAARGLSLASSTPCIGVTTLEALAASVPAFIAGNRQIVATADARRQEIYKQTFSFSEGGEFPAMVEKPMVIPVAQGHKFLPEQAFVILGSGADLLKKAGHLQDRTCEILDLDPNPDARIIAAIAQKKDQPSPHAPAPAPVYLRAPDAKLPGGIDPA